MSSDTKQDLKFYLFDPRDPSPEMVSRINKTYAFWHDIWFRSLKAIEPIERLYSDEFMRCDKVGVLYHVPTDQPILLCFYTSHDFHLNQTLDDSYFQAWPREILEKLRGQYETALVCSHWTLGREQRLMPGVDMKHFVLGLIHCVFQDSGLPVLLTTSRNTKKVNQLLSFMGCQPVAKDVIYHGEPADMFTLTLEQSRQNFTHEYPKELRELAQYLWETRNVVPRKFKIAG
jgi:hypothetical protein